MPRTAETRTLSALDQIQKQIQQLLGGLRSEIRSKETDLKRLKEEESKLSSLVGLRATDGRKPSPRVERPGTGRIDWGRVLEQMPNQFKAGDLRKVREVANKRPTEIFAGITRWMEAGLVKRKDKGLYERVK